MPMKKLKEFLDGQSVKYVTISHPVAYTAQEIAALAHISSKELAKTVIVKIDSALAMAVLPASYEVDLSLLRAATGAKTLSLPRKQNSKTSSRNARSVPCRPLETSTEWLFMLTRALLRTKTLRSMLAPTTSWFESPTKTSNGWSSRRS